MTIRNNEELDRVKNTFDSAGRIGLGMGALAAAGTYKFFVRANRYLVDQGYGKEYSWLNAGVKFAGVYLGTNVGINVAYMVGSARGLFGKYFVEGLKRRKESVDKEVEADGDGTTSES